jgi:hypothetical protein
MSDATQTELAHANPLPVRARVWNRFVGIFRLSPTGAIGLFIILFFALLAIFSAWIMPHDPIAAYTDKVLHPPSAEFWFGTDGNGMDVFSRVIYGAKFGFGIAIPAVILSLVIGIPVGLNAGYRGGLLDEVLMRFVDGACGGCGDGSVVAQRHPCAGCSGQSGICPCRASRGAWPALIQLCRKRGRSRKPNLAHSICASFA